MMMGLEMAWELGIRDLIYELDSSCIIELVRSPINPFHIYACITAKVKSLLARYWEVDLKHIMREGNTCANWLAKCGGKEATYYYARTTHLLALAPFFWPIL